MADGDEIFDDDGNIIPDSSGDLRTEGASPDCCCDDPPYYELVPCAGQIGAPTNLVISKTIFDLIGGTGAFVRVGLYCFTVGDEVDPAGKVKTGVYHGYSGCDECAAAVFPCVPDNDHELSDDAIEDSYPDLVAKVPGMKVCPCFITIGTFGEGGSVKLVDNGVGGHSYAMIGDPIDRGPDGHCRGYHYSSINWPVNAQVGDLQIGSQAFFGTTCSEDDGEADNPSNDFFEVELSIVLCCSAADGWRWDLNSPQGVSAFNFLCFSHSGGAGPFGSWNGAANPFATIDNEQALDVDCQENGTGSDSGCGDGKLSFFAHAPGF